MLKTIRRSRRFTLEVMPVSTLVLAGLAGCGGEGARTPDPSTDPTSRLKHTGVGAFEDATVHGARMVPEKVDTASFTADGDGSRRGVLAGYRVLARPDGAVHVSDERLAQAPQATLEVPSRLGGGYLYVVGTSLLRSDTWLSEAVPVFAAQGTISRVFVGLDRVYVRTPTGHVAIDPRTGAPKDIGPFPPGPQVVAYGARDGWRAAAIADLVGLVTTEDAGATWKKLELGIDPKTVTVNAAGSLVVSGIEQGRTNVLYELREGGQAVRLSATSTRPPPRGAKSPKVQQAEPDDDDDGADAKPPEVRAFGPRPLVAAIEDGWPLTDGVAIVARDGALARIRLDDGALLEAVPRAYSLFPSRCHGVSLHRPDAKGAFGFVCGEPRGKTDIYAYDPMGGKLVLLRRFDSPRVVLSSGQGSLAVKGACSAAAPTEVDGQHTYCILDYENRFREVRVKGDVGSERLVVLADRRIAILSPPQGEVTTARLTLLDTKGAARTVPLTFPRITADVARVLRHGVWLEGVEERRPGVLGAWVDAGGSVLGLEIAVDGTVTVGQYVREAGLPVVSGRYGLGFTNARRLYETLDGGMTWTSREAPEPLVALPKVSSRAVGPIGALAAGWLRVGWGERDGKKEATRAKPNEAPRPTSQSVPPVVLACEGRAKPPKVPPPEREPEVKVAVAKPPVPSAKPPPPVIRPSFGGLYMGSGFGANRFPQELTSFFASAAPKLRAGERPLLNADAYDPFDRAVRGAPLAKIYAFGPKGQDPDPQSRFLVRWLSPYDGYGEVHSTAPSALPPTLLEGMRAGAGGMYGSYYPGVYTSSWQVGVGDDGAHTLLAARGNGARPGLALWELEADRGPVPVRRVDGEELTEIESAVRVEGKWVVATPESQSMVGLGGAATLLFVIDGGTARLLARIPRAAPIDGARAQGKLARRSDGRGVGYVVDSAGAGSRGRSERWVLPVDLETGVVSEPVSLGSPDYRDTGLAVCAGDEQGYVLDAPLPAGALRVRGPKGTLSFTGVLARVRLSASHACVEAASGMLNVGTDDPLVTSPKGGPVRSHLRVSALVSGMRYPLDCVEAK